MNITKLKKNCEREYNERLKLHTIYNMDHPTTEQILQFFILSIKYPDAEFNTIGLNKNCS